MLWKLMMSSRENVWKRRSKNFKHVILEMLTNKQTIYIWYMHVRCVVFLFPFYIFVWYVNQNVSNFEANFVQFSNCHHGA